MSVMSLRNFGSCSGWICRIHMDSKGFCAPSRWDYQREDDQGLQNHKQNRISFLAVSLVLHTKRTPQILTLEVHLKICLKTFVLRPQTTLQINLPTFTEITVLHFQKSYIYFWRNFRMF